MTDGIFNVKQSYKLDEPERIKDLRPRELLNNLVGITNENICVDFGSGTGTFALPMAELVGPKGRVYAVDNSEEMLAHIRAKNPPNNLILLHSNVERTGLNSQIADICLLAFILHEVVKPDNVIAEASRLLKSNGRIVIVEWKAELDTLGPPRERRISQERIVQLFSRVGLSLASYIDWSENHYVAVGKN